MVFGLVLLIVIYLLYVLLIQGALFKLILGAFGWLGMYWYLSGIPEFGNHRVFADNDMFTWAMGAPTILVLLVLLCTKEE